MYSMSRLGLASSRKVAKYAPNFETASALSRESSNWQFWRGTECGFNWTSHHLALIAFVKRLGARWSLEGRGLLPRIEDYCNVRNPYQASNLFIQSPRALTIESPKPSCRTIMCVGATTKFPWKPKNTTCPKSYVHTFLNQCLPVGNSSHESFSVLLIFVVFLGYGPRLEGKRILCPAEVFVVSWFLAWNYCTDCGMCAEAFSPQHHSADHCRDNFEAEVFEYIPSWQGMHIHVSTVWRGQCRRLHMPDWGSHYSWSREREAKSQSYIRSGQGTSIFILILN